MREKNIKVLKVEPGKHPEVCVLKNELDDLQKAVSIGADSQGLIEIVEIDKGICLLDNEEGKLIGLQGNRKIGDDIITGVFYITSEDKEGNLSSLTDEQIEKYKERFWEIEEYTTQDILSSICTKFYNW